MSFDVATGLSPDHQHLVRAELIVLPAIQVERPFSFNLGPFTIVESPGNNIYHFYDRIGQPWDPDAPLPPADHDYPLSQLTIDTVMPPGTDVIDLDTQWQNLELVFRLFGKGCVFIREHKVWRLEADASKTEIALLRFNLPDSNVTAPSLVYWLGDYKFDPDGIDELFNKYWPVLVRSDKGLRVALRRFSLSYDGRNHSDRLIDLMIALEALFSEGGDTAYKIATRCSSLLHPPGKAREELWLRVKKLYSPRNDILHGREIGLGKKISNDDVSTFEALVREVLRTVLTKQLEGKGCTKASDFDQFILRPWQ